MDAKQKGDSGERAAELYLENVGLQPLARNVRYPGGEIDLIMLEGRTVVFVEVKMRSHGIEALEAITPRKRANISKVAVQFLYDHALLDHPARFDVVVVDRPGGDMIVSHLEDAFEFTRGRYFV